MTLNAISKNTSKSKIFGQSLSSSLPLTVSFFLGVSFPFRDSDNPSCEIGQTLEGSLDIEGGSNVGAFFLKHV